MAVEGESGAGSLAAVLDVHPSPGRSRCGQACVACIAPLVIQAWCDALSASDGVESSAWTQTLACTHCGGRVHLTIGPRQVSLVHRTGAHQSCASGRFATGSRWIFAQVRHQKLRQ
jgi:hypothetical protein